MRKFLNTLTHLCIVLTGLTVIPGIAGAQSSGTYEATNLLSDGSVPAVVTDPSFVDAWGVSEGPAFWINTAGTGLDYVATAAGKINFRVVIPSASGATGSVGSPSGTVFSGAANGAFLLPNGQKATFLFCSLDGIITGWNAGLGMNNAVTQVVINNSAQKASYTDMALLNTPNGAMILASNFGQGSSIEVYDANFAPAKLAGNFTDPNLPAGYAPFSVHALNGQVYVTYALRSAGGAQVVGAGDGIVDVYDNQGNFVARAVTGGNLNAPWGVAIAPTTFGAFGGDVLVGNFGDGRINAYDPNNYSYQGQLVDGTGTPLSYQSLWEITFGAGGTSANLVGDPNTLYFAAGLQSEQHGLFGAIANSASPNGSPTFGLSTSTPAATVAAGSSAVATVSAVPTNGFTGGVTLSCTGPTGVTCSFFPAQLSVGSAASATSQVTIQTTGSMAALSQYGPWEGRGLMLAGTLFLPFGSLLLFRRRYSAYTRVLGLLVLLVAASGLAMGCSGSSMSMTQAPNVPSTPAPTQPSTPTAGMQQVVITATSGSITKTATIQLTVQ